MHRILIVDDKEENLYLLRTLLQGNGYLVDEARNGADALVKARESPPHLVISDLFMPVMDGYTLLRHWKADARLKEIPFVVYTATYVEPQDEQLALGLGADAFMTKPAEPDVFMDRIRVVLAADQAGRLIVNAPVGDEATRLTEYSEVLVRKLEKRALELEQTNRELAAELTARSRAEEAAVEARAQLRGVFDNLPDVVMVVDANGVIQFMNRLLPGHTMEEVIGSSFSSRVPPEQAATLQAALDAVLTTGEVSSYEVSMPAPDGGQRWLSNRIGPVRRTGAITGAVIIGRDVTDKKRTEAQLIAADRMASVGILAAGVAHEINNPLAAVMANLDLAFWDVTQLTRRQSLSTELLDEIRDARDCAERIRTIVRDLKIFSREEGETRGPVDTSRVLESTIRMVRNEIRHRARLVRDYGDVPLVEANESRLGQVFLNMIVNAAHAIPEGRAEDHEIRVSTRRDANGGVVVEISDTGAGMPPEVQRQLFTPFFTTKPVGVGTGLGLAICQRIVIDLRGTIEVESAPGKGTSFRIHLPPSRADAEPMSAATAAAPSALRRGRILVIDDEPMLAAVIRRTLSSEHEVVATTRGREAIDRVRAGERFDVILCDLMMPDVTGMDLHAELTRRAPDQAARIIFMTGGAFTVAAREFLEHVPNLRFDKPFDHQQLRALVNDRIR